MEDRQNLLSSIGCPNNSETFRCAQGKNQVSCYSCDALEMVDLLKSDCSLDFASSLNHLYNRQSLKCLWTAVKMIEVPPKGIVTTVGITVTFTYSHDST